MKAQLEMRKSFGYILTVLVALGTITTIGAFFSMVTVFALASLGAPNVSTSAYSMVWGITAVWWILGAYAVTAPAVYTWSWSLKKTSEQRKKVLKRTTVIVFCLAMTLPTLAIGSELIVKVFGG
jgi:hypothetical protein